MVRAIAQRKSRELWTEVNKIKSSKTHATNCMDDVTGSEQIVKIFFDKYCELYNSVGFENLQLTNIISDNTVDVQMYCMNGTLKLNMLISVLFSAMLTHGVVPGGLLSSTLVPIPKNKRGSKTDSNNYI